jgi:hypothetical protein
MSIPLQVHNDKTTDFSLLYRAIEGAELGALPLDQLPPFCERGLTLITRKRVITQVLLLVQVVVNLPPNVPLFYWAPKIGYSPIVIHAS